MRCTDCVTVPEESGRGETRSPAAPRAWHHGPVLSGLLTGYQAAGETEAADLERMTRLAASGARPVVTRSLPLHFTASALVRAPATAAGCCCAGTSGTERWLQVGGHGDPGETDPLAIALREAAEETGLTDLVPWPDASLRHAVVCYVPPVGDRARARARGPAVLPRHGEPGRDRAGERALAAALAAPSTRRGNLVGGNNLTRHTACPCRRPVLAPARWNSLVDCIDFRYLTEIFRRNGLWTEKPHVCTMVSNACFMVLCTAS